LQQIEIACGVPVRSNETDTRRRVFIGGGFIGGGLRAAPA
jgi:hypothetical protein